MCVVPAPLSPWPYRGPEARDSKPLPAARPAVERGVVHSGGVGGGAPAAERQVAHVAAGRDERDCKQNRLACLGRRQPSEQSMESRNGGREREREGLHSHTPRHTHEDRERPERRKWRRWHCDPRSICYRFRRRRVASARRSGHSPRTATRRLLLRHRGFRVSSLRPLRRRPRVLPRPAASGLRTPRCCRCRWCWCWCC